MDTQTGPKLSQEEKGGSDSTATASASTTAASTSKRHRQQQHQQQTIATTSSRSQQQVAQQAERQHQERTSSNNDQGKENKNLDSSERFCFECHRSLAKSRHLINIAGQLHKWHPECFRCNVCKHPLDRETSCHVYKDKIVCREDYARLQRDNSVKCSRCHWPIAASDWVRRAGEYVYHLACFSCDICLRQLSTGEQFTINIQEKNTAKLLCRLHFAIENPPQGAPPTGNGAGCGPSTAASNGSSPARGAIAAVFDPIGTHKRGNTVAAAAASEFPHQHQQQNQQLHSDQYFHLLASSGASEQLPPLDRKSAAPGGDFEEAAASLMHRHHHHQGQLPDELAQQSAAGHAASTSSSNGSPGGGGGGSGIVSMPSKSKRVRTTFTEDQLSILQTHFQIDSNPDGQDLERIATITGLSKRVTQVWFQNSRARQKKYMIKRKPSNASSSSSAAASMPGGSSLQVPFGALVQQHGGNSGAASDFYGQPAGGRPKWSNMSERSDQSLDGTGIMGDEMDDDDETRSSDDDDGDGDEHLIVSEDSEHK